MFLTLSCLSLFDPWTVAHQAPLSMGFSRQGYWSGLPCPPPGDLPDPGIESASPALAGRFFTDSEPQGKPKSTGVGESEVTQSCPTLCDPWTVAHQAPLSTGFARQEYWSGLPFPSPGDLPDSGIEPASLALAGRLSLCRLGSPEPQ